MCADEEVTIVLELTPREAAALFEMCLVFKWQHPDYGHEVRSMFKALEEVQRDFADDNNAEAVSVFGEVEGGCLTLIDTLK